MANNKVQLANGTVLIDITDTTANASDVLSGEYFYNASGVKTQGSLTIPSTYTVTKTLTNVTTSNNDTEVLAGGSFYMDLTPSSGKAIGAITVTMGGIDITEQVFKAGVGEKIITQNRVYNAEDDWLEGYSSVNVNVPNSYSVSDEGKVVSNGTLTSQSSATYTSNATYDTTLVNSVTVNVSGGSVPTGSITISQNGTYDVTDYASAVVNVQPASPTLTLLDTITVSEQVSDIKWYLPAKFRANPILYVVGTVNVSASDWLYTQFDTLATNTASYTSKGTSFNLAYRIVGYPKVTVDSKTINGYTLAQPVGTNRVTNTSKTSFEYLRIFPYTSSIKITSASLSIYGMS